MHSSVNCFDYKKSFDAFELFGSKLSPKSDDVFKYKNQNFEDQIMKFKRTCVTQKSMEKNQCQNNDELSSVLSKCDEQEVQKAKVEEVVVPRQAEFDNAIAPFRKINYDNTYKVVRRDVINKTIFRIIRRFFYSLLEKVVPDYKIQKRYNLMNMLASFAEFLFPMEESIIEVSEVLCALMFRREMLLMRGNSDLRERVQVFLDVQSKYTHKLLHPVMENKHFKVIFNYFLQYGVTFFENDENVQKNPERYREEFQKIKEINQSTSYGF